MRKTFVLEPGPGALNDYYEWFKDARPGDVLVYHTGNLHFDRHIKHFVDPDEETIARVESLRVLAVRIYDDQQDGYLLLTQKRIDEGVCEYWAIRLQTELEKRQSLPSQARRAYADA